MRGSCRARPLRQNYIMPHCPQRPPVSCRLLLSRAPLRALRVKATGVMQNCLRSSRSHSRRRFLGRIRALRAAVSAPWWFVWRRGIGQLLRKSSSQWPAASHHQLAPARPPGPRRCAALAPRAGLPVRPPRGLPQSGASGVANGRATRRFRTFLGHRQEKRTWHFC